MPDTEPARGAFQPKLSGRETLAASAIVLVGLILRIRIAWITYLNPDEASHALWSFTGWREMFRYSYQVDKHPPLLMYMTHLVLFLSRTDFALRIIPLLCGTLFPIFMGIWLMRVAGKVAGITALLLLTLTPHLVNVSAQLRSYTLAFLLLSLSLVAFEIAIDTGRWLPMVAFDVLLALCVCADYSMAWFAGSAGLYALMRLRGSPVAVKVTWAAGQIAPLIFYGALFWGNVRHIPTSAVAENARSHWLSHGFPHHGTYLTFPFVNTGYQFIYVMASIPMGILSVAMFAAGMYFLWAGRTNIRREKARPLAILLTLPFLLGILGGYAKIYPYGPSRHSLIVGIFAVCGVAVFLEFVPRPSRIPIAWAAAVPIVLWLSIPNPDGLDLPQSRNRKSQMLECLSYMHATIPPDAPIMTDRETLQMLMFYEGSRRPPANMRKWFIETPLANRWRIRTREYQFTSRPQFKSALAAFRKQYGMGADQPVWILDGGFSVDAGPVDKQLPFTRAVRLFHTP